MNRLRPTYARLRRALRTLMAGLLLFVLVAAAGPGPSVPIDPAFDTPDPAGSAAGIAGWRADQEDEMAAVMAEGIRAFGQPDYDAARAAFRRAIRLDARDPLPRVWLARCDIAERTDDFNREEKYRQAMRELDRALRRDDTSREARYWKARLLVIMGGARNLAEAKAFYRGLIAGDALYEDVMLRLLEAHIEARTLDTYLIELDELARANPDDPAVLFRFAGALQQNGDFGRAEAMLRLIGRRWRDFAPGWVNYTLALTLFELEQWGEGTQAYLDAITFMENPAVARTMWDDARYIADLFELARFRRATTVEEYRAALRAFWKKRDPTKTSPDNERISVHYQRLKVAWESYRLAGMRTAWNDPDTDRLLRKPPTYDIESPFTDMGLVYLRHGEPDETSHSHDVEVDNMSWAYFEEGERPEMFFHFEQHALGGGWRLVPFPDPSYAESRTSMDPRFGALLRGVDPQIESMFAQDANQDIQQGLTSDTYIPEREVIGLTVFNDEATFKAAGGLSRYEAYWAVPIAELLTPEALQRGSVTVKVKISLFGTDYREIYRNERILPLRLTSDMAAGSISIDQEVMAVPPGNYLLALQISDETEERMQIQEIETVIEAYPTGELLISDVEICSQIREGTFRGPLQTFAKGNYTVIPLPSRVYPPNQPALIYFDIYGLAKDEFNATRYRISYRLDPGSGEQGRMGTVRIGGREGRYQETGGIIVTLDEESGIFSDVHKTLTIDLGESSFRTYTLRITVEDLVTGREAVQTTFFRVNRGG